MKKYLKKKKELRIKQNNKIFALPIVILLMMLGNCDTIKSQATTPPNIVIIMVDDLGYADVGFNGCKDIPTPHIDKLAENGVRFSSGYVTAPMCGPSRAGFISGRIQSNFGWYGNPDTPLDPKQGLPDSMKTVAHYIQDQGYVTGIVGKWHMGTAPHQHPNNMGYTDFYGFLSGGHLYYPNNHPSYNGKYLDMAKPFGMRDMHHAIPILHNNEPVEWEQYLTHELTDQSVNFIEKNKDNPFFLFVSYNAPHEYLEAPEETIAMFPKEEMTVISGVKPQNRSVYAAMTFEMDRGVGKLIETLERLELKENTIVWFLSDNGGMKRTSDNRPLRGAKWDSYEGGLRVPLVVSWPGHVEAGSILDAPITTLDLGATSVALAGGDLAKVNLDGVDITSYMTGKTKNAPHKELFWRTDRRIGQERGVLRVGDYKIIIQNENVQLFNLKEDLSETTDLSTSQPVRAQEMLSRWKTLNKSSQSPLWKPLTKEERRMDKYQYQSYEWLKGSQFYKADQN